MKNAIIIFYQYVFRTAGFQRLMAHEAGWKPAVRKRMTMELRHLRYFVTVAREGDITRAAEKLNMQQPPLSQQIKGAGERDRRRHCSCAIRAASTLTDAGRSFLADAEAVLAEVDRAAARARRTARGEVGRIAVGFTTSAPFHPLVARAIREFRRQPARRLLRAGGNRLGRASGRPARGAARHRLHPLAASPTRKGLAVHALLQEDMVAALPARHRRCAGRASP